MSETIQDTPSKAKSSTYKCDKCKKQFTYLQGDKVCPHCGNDDEAMLFILEQKNSDTVEEMYTEDDFQGG